jgi:PhnB protein
MALVCTYLNFQDCAEEAMTSYRELFNGEVVGQFVRFGDMPFPDGPNVAEQDRDKIMHMEVTIAGGHVLMATDMLASQGQKVAIGNSTTVMVELDGRDEVDRLFAALASGTEEQPPALMPWGQYWSVCLDRFGIRWMLASD